MCLHLFSSTLKVLPLSVDFGVEKLQLLLLLGELDLFSESMAQLRLGFYLLEHLFMLIMHDSGLNHVLVLSFGLKTLLHIHAVCEAL